MFMYHRTDLSLVSPEGSDIPCHSIVTVQILHTTTVFRPVEDR